MSEIKKIGGIVQISRELAMDEGIIPPTQQYLAKKEALRAKYESERDKASVLLRTALPLLDAIEDPIARLVLDLHQRAIYPSTFANPYGYWLCFGCEIDGYEAEHPRWPCQTTEAIAKHYGIDLPESWYIERPEDGSLDA